MQLTLTNEEAAVLKSALAEAIQASSNLERDYGFLISDKYKAQAEDLRSRWTQLKEKLP